jgi:hypothetical protein
MTTPNSDQPTPEERERRFYLPASDVNHEHRSEGVPIRMTPTTKPNIAWRCSCGWWHFVHLRNAWSPPASDEHIRLAWLARLEGTP